MLVAKKMYLKLARHMEQKHADESDVSLALSFLKKSEERKQKWLELRNKGNLLHNQDVLEMVL